MKLKTKQPHQNAVYTLTPNPALDLSGHVTAIRANEKNYVNDVRRDPGGNGINAARIATRIGARVVALGFVGGAAGTEISELLKKEKVHTDFILIKENTRINITVTNEADHKQTRLTFPGPQVSAAEEKLLLAKIQKITEPGILILGGSLPSGLRAGFYERIFRIANRNDLGVVLDAPAETLRQVSLPRSQRLLFIKPNDLELSEYVGRPLRGETALITAARELLNISALVCVSVGGKGAYFVTRHAAWRGFPPKVKARGTVGAGDSMVGAITTKLAMAGICSAESIEDLSNSDKVEEAFKWGLAAGAATATSLGTSLAEGPLIRRLVPLSKVKKLKINSPL